MLNWSSIAHSSPRRPLVLVKLTLGNERRGILEKGKGAQGGWRGGGEEMGECWTDMGEGEEGKGDLSPEITIFNGDIFNHQLHLPVVVVHHSPFLNTARGRDYSHHVHSK